MLNFATGLTGGGVVLDHLRSGSNLALLPVFVGFDVLFPFTELRPKKYQLSSRF
ncbi:MULTISPECIES: hypothetical protein [unclassified Rhizobium]|uniref:hypothetical protein n=1 Tax=unclassified Rhizobium TaxID=2613769 RepID=UPI001484DF83|nr:MULTISPECIES: hypothetical protein [unclassified Rhizobium]